MGLVETPPLELYSKRSVTGRNAQELGYDWLPEILPLDGV